MEEVANAVILTIMFTEKLKCNQMQRLTKKNQGNEKDEEGTRATQVVQ